ncbi:Tetratricopeptide domain protein [Anaeromyxobacter sp. K]|uniref:tetratricopeptide repeat protein n=1 Tax=Anaeromyxobacter sp. (strain K) TaxID=447217 RepID=UPI00017BE257|nr:tetratricopeptide repeat protein [Anaeromyxobacter sp. K]ACG72646.1 Tetratricopeptide domain protein [Anaeromyxobacter sp. K]
MAIPAHKLTSYIAELISIPGEFRVHQLVREISHALGTAPSVDVRAAMHTALGMANCLLGKDEEAVRQHEMACQLDRSFVNTYNYAISLERLGRPEEAVHWYVLAMQTDEGYKATALANFATCLWQLGEIEEAHRVLAEAVRIVSSDDDLPAVALRAAELGLDDVALQLLARHAAKTCGVPLDEAHPVKTISAAPAEWKRATVSDYALVCAVLRALGFASHLPSNAGLPDGGYHHSRLSDELDSQVLEWSRNMRSRANSADAAEYVSG